MGDTSKSGRGEMNISRQSRQGGAMEAKRTAGSDAPGDSSARSRSTKSGADRAGSSTSGRGGAGNPSGTSSSRATKEDQRPG